MKPNFSILDCIGLRLFIALSNEGYHIDAPIVLQVESPEMRNKHMVHFGYLYNVLRDCDGLDKVSFFHDLVVAEVVPHPLTMVVSVPVMHKGSVSMPQDATFLLLQQVSGVGGHICNLVPLAYK